MGAAVPHQEPDIALRLIVRRAENASVRSLHGLDLSPEGGVGKVVCPSLHSLQGEKALPGINPV